VLLVEAAFCAIDGVFNSLITLAVVMLVLGTHAFRIPLRKLLPLSALGLSFLIVINAFKGDFRFEATQQKLSTSARIDLATRRFFSTAADPASLFTAENASFNVRRMNQGSITARIMFWTPSREPFANGETIRTAVRAALVPRLLDPGKYTAGGGDLYPRFTGLPLLGNTSINLSVPGEVYANFGRAGGVAGMLCFGLLLGGFFRFFATRARESSVWWAWQGFVLLAAIGAESAVGEVVNHLVKGSFVMMVTILAVPGWRDLMKRRRRRVAA
jgi:hypothetical protein